MGTTARRVASEVRRAVRGRSLINRHNLITMEDQMRPLKLMTAMVCALALIATSSRIRLGAQEKEQKKPCCEATVEAGKKCKHECCKKAAEDGKVCEKCHPKKEDKK